MAVHSRHPHHDTSLAGFENSDRTVSGGEYYDGKYLHLNACAVAL
ncbi:MAG: hypothetical protein ACPGCY_06990 [Henriciella sp.]